MTAVVGGHAKTAGDPQYHGKKQASMELQNRLNLLPLKEEEAIQK